MGLLDTIISNMIVDHYILLLAGILALIPFIRLIQLFKNTQIQLILVFNNSDNGWISMAIEFFG